MVAEAARMWNEAGVSTIPVLDNGTKKPAIRWAEYQAHIPDIIQVNEWWGNGRQFGLALICGSVSGNLEMTEVEGRAAHGDALVAIENAMDQVGASHIWDLLTTHGYMEMSPSGGLHVLYRIADHPVPGNTKIAQAADQLVLAETRGEGGYVIVAPTTGLCHPSGEPWTLVRGAYGEVPTISWEDRCLFHEALRLALNEVEDAPLAPVRSPLPPARDFSGDRTGLTPNDDFELRTDWADILEPHGWRLESRHGDERHWTRPGKNPREGASATTGHSQDRERLWVFSTSTSFEANTSYTKYAAWALLNHNGNLSAATRELAERGYGSPGVSRELEVLDWAPGGNPLRRRDNDTSNADHLYARVKGRYLYVAAEKMYYWWNGRQWTPDDRGALWNEFTDMAEAMTVEAEERGDKKGARRWEAAGNVGKITAALNALHKLPGMTVTMAEMNRGTNLLNVTNGTLDLTTGEFSTHERESRQTRMFGAIYEPSATCPNFNRFMEQALPDADLRKYVQRALGYSLLGDVDHRAMFLIYGPSGTGKSTLMETMRAVFGEYGATAAAGTFRARTGDGPSNDLHGLRSKRFVTTSETAENANFDEDLLKRLTGRDSVVSRQLYEVNQEWVPECTIWLATNHPPRFNSDDDAIWRRAKLVPFTTQFLGQGEIFDMARKYLIPEASGILNWLLGGLADYYANGLGEPEAVAVAATALRAQSDSVLRFLDDHLHDGVLLANPNERIPSRELYSMYQTWCSRSGERALGARRFSYRMESSGHGISCTRDTGPAIFVGLGRSKAASILGTMLSLPYQRD